MDLTAFAVGVLAGIVIRVVSEPFTAWLGHRMSIDRTKAERRVEDDTARIDRCADIFAARVAYVVAWHRKRADWRALKDARLAMERRYPTDMPEVVLLGTSEWDKYLDTEYRMRHDTGTPADDRVVGIEAMAFDVQRLLAERRAAARA